MDHEKFISGQAVLTQAPEIHNLAFLSKKWNLRQIQCFVVLASTPHFGNAARLLNMSQSALSRQIQALEQYFQLNLVQRDSHSVAITPSGLAFLKGCRIALAELQKGASNAALIQRGAEGELRVGYTDFAIISILPRILARFSESHPGIALDSWQGSTDVMLELLHEHQLDIIFATGPVQDELVEKLEITTYPLIAIFPESHPLAKCQPLQMSDLRKEKFIFGNSKYWKHFLFHIQRAFTIAEYEPKVVMRAYNSEGIFGLVSANIGITIYPDIAENHHRSGIVMRPIRDLKIDIPILAVWRKADNYIPLQYFVTNLND